MKKTIGFDEFVAEFREMGKENNFSHEAFKTLFDYFEQVEEDTGREMELDVVAICRDWVEYTLDELKLDFGLYECVTIEEAAEELIKKGRVSGVIKVSGDPETLLVWR